MFGSGSIRLEFPIKALTLDCILSWSKHIDTTVAKMGRSLSIIKRCSTFLTALSTRQVLQALVLLHLDHCSVVLSSATKREFAGKLQLAQNRAAMHTPQDMPTRLFTVPKSRTDYGRHIVLHKTMTTWNSIPHQVTDACSKIRF